MKNKISTVQTIRHIIQIISFILFPGLFLSIFMAMRDIFTAIINGNFSFAQYLGQLFLLIAIIGVTAIFGRFFCGYICSFGAMGDLVNFISSKTIKKSIKINSKADRILKWLKYGVLASIVIVIWTLGVKISNNISPWDVFGIYSSPAGWADLSAWLTLGGALLLLIIVGSFFVERFFCRYLCPLGAILDAASNFRLLQIKKPTEECGNCKACTNRCAMGIALSEENQISCGECINCFKCADACPRKNVTVTTAPAIAGAAAAISVSGFYYAGTLDTPPKVSNETLNSSIETVEDYDGALYQNGVHTGSGKGYRGVTQTEVTVQNGMITDITVTSSDDDRQYLNAAMNSVIPQIISTQSPYVNAVSGATFSSDGIMEAVANALSVNSTDVKTVDSIDKNSKIQNDTIKETLPKTIEPSYDNKLPELPKEDNINETQVPDNAANSQNAINIADGVYTGTGSGFRGNTTVEVTVKNGEITDITLTSSSDDREYLNAAVNSVIPQIISQQSPSVSAVSGATFSSNGIMEAVADALGIEGFETQTPASRGKGGRGHGSMRMF